MTMRDRLNALVAGPFIRAVGILVGGTVIAQVILGITLPIATRLYTPEDFSVLAVFTGIVSIISVATCMRYDIAVPLPDNDADAVALALLAIAVAAAVSLLALTAILLFADPLAAWLGHPILSPYLWLVPVATFFAGAYSTFQFWFVRSKRFSDLARNRIVQAMGSSFTQIGLGAACIAPLGLLLGQVVNSGLGAVRLALRFRREQASTIALVSVARIGKVARTYDRFPRFSALEAVCNSAAIYLPIILLSAWAIGPEAGYLSLGMYAMQVPMSLIGNAVSQVYMSRGPEEHRAGRLGTLTNEVLAALLKTGVGPIICLGIVAPELFRLVFGPDWTRAGVLVAWMSPWFVMQFLATPVSLAFHITNRLPAAFLLQVFGLVLRTGAVVLAARLPGAPLSEGYALSGAAFYLVYLILIVAVTRGSTRGFLHESLRAAPIIFAWAFVGGLGAFVLSLVDMQLN